MPPTPVLSVRRAVLVLLADNATAAAVAPLVAPFRGQVVPLAGSALALLFPLADQALRAALMLLRPPKGIKRPRIGAAIGTVTAVGPSIAGQTVDAARTLAERAPPDTALVTATLRDCFSRELQPIAQMHETAVVLPGERSDMIFELVPETAQALAGGGFLSRRMLLRNAVVAGFALLLILAALIGGWRPWRAPEAPPQDSLKGG
ncbi:MAG: hypothetical protein EXQ96_01035 [Alphaproteobacteria bacterium]|nr:hypothetical protein [Alphaproteobacteria bacterium]